MVRSATLILIGYWSRSATDELWPRPEQFVDQSWDADDRYLLAEYLERGFIARSYMGYSTCRICGADNGALELTDGTFVWPDGLSHYVREHAVRLPESFETHALGRIEVFEAANRDESFWRSVGKPGR